MYFEDNHTVFGFYNRFAFSTFKIELHLDRKPIIFAQPNMIDLYGFDDIISEGKTGGKKKPAQVNMKENARYYARRARGRMAGREANMLWKRK